MWKRVVFGKPTHQRFAQPVKQTHPWRQVTVLHKYNYVDASHVIAKIQDTAETCDVSSYLDCVIEYQEVVELCGAFATVLATPHIRDPDTFVRVFESLD